MQSDIIREIATSIINEQIILNWRFYVITFALFFVSNAAANGTASYFKKRGETLATSADMQEILDQITKTTQASEEVRSAITQADWAAREWQTIRRIKLEELLSSAYSLDQWLTNQRLKWLHNEVHPNDTLPMDRIKVLSALYFPELQAETAETWKAYQKASVLILTTHNRLRQDNLEINEQTQHQAINDFSEQSTVLYENARISIQKLEEKSSNLMKKLTTLQ